MSPDQGTGSTALEDAGAQAAGRALISTALQRNPLVALAAAVIGPIIGLFRTRGQAPVAVNKVRLESYSSTPVGPRQPGSAGQPPANRQAAGREGADERRKLLRSGWCPQRRRRSRTASVAAGATRAPAGSRREKGGQSHGQS